MKKMIAILSLMSIASTVMAGEYDFSCSNHDGTITISDKGNMANVNGTSHPSEVLLLNVEILSPADNPKVKVVSDGERIVLTESSSCRGKSKVLVFKEKLIISDVNSSKTIAQDELVCRYTSTSQSDDSTDCSSK